MSSLKRVRTKASLTMQKCNHLECRAAGRYTWVAPQGFARHNAAYDRKKNMASLAIASKAPDWSEPTALPTDAQVDASVSKYHEAKDGAEALRMMAADLDKGVFNGPKMANDMRIIATAISMIYTEMKELDLRTLQRKAQAWDNFTTMYDDYRATLPKAEED